MTHSYSCDVHGEMGLDYSLVEVSKDKLAEFLRNNDFDGFNVTIPYKKDVIPHLANLDEAATLCGAVNTVKRIGNTLLGFNTDVDGMRYMIETKGVSLRGKNLLILGSGGTSNTAQTLAKMCGAKNVHVVSRTGVINYANCYDFTDTQIIINTTPVGMHPDIYAKPIELARFNNLVAVFDCIYNPFLTELLQEAKALNLVYSDGLPMLVRQALLAERIWTGQNSPLAQTEKLITSVRRKKTNMVLFGMPSCGKTTLGKILAQKLGKPFVDLDEYLTNEQGKTPAEIIQSNGEQSFRALESAAVSQVAKLCGTVISLGGGTVLDSANVQKLKKNGVLIYVKRDLHLLTTDNRPLSQAHGVENLFNQRKEIYQSVADAQTDNSGNLENAAKEIERAYEIACDKWR